MATNERIGGTVGTCPECAGVFTFEDRSWACEDCGFVPNHGAD
ncbi:MAG: hypothetical protein V5A61_12540 [Haloarculaceae archaeon]|jgi:ribosomal protein S27AE